MRPRVCAPLLVLILAGCGTGQLPLSSAAATDVHQRSVNAGVAMAKAGRVSSAFDHARRVVGDAGSTSIELLAQSGNGIKGSVLLRITSTVAATGFGSASKAQACFRYTFDDLSGGIDPNETRCPRTTPLALPSAASIPSLPPDAQQRIRVGLRAGDAEQALGQAFTGLLVRTARVAGLLGVSVQAGTDCDFGRRLADGSVEVWYVPKVLSQPGELGCTPEAAVAGLGKSSPH